MTQEYAQNKTRKESSPKVQAIVGGAFFLSIISVVVYVSGPAIAALFK